MKEETKHRTIHDLAKVKGKIAKPGQTKNHTPRFPSPVSGNFVDYDEDRSNT